VVYQLVGDAMTNLFQRVHADERSVRIQVIKLCLRETQRTYFLLITTWRNIPIPSSVEVVIIDVVLHSLKTCYTFVLNLAYLTACPWSRTSICL